jgi:signal transduction histidine kinase
VAQAVDTRLEGRVPGDEGVTEHETRPARRGSGWLFALAFAAYTLAALVFLAFGVAAVYASRNADFHARLHEWGLRPGFVGRAAQGIADASHKNQPAGQLAIDYGFSVFNLALAGFLLWLRPRDGTARRLAIGMVGTAAIFNLQAHGVYEAGQHSWVDSRGHDAFQMIAAISYLYALLRFPDGHLVPRWRGWAQAVLYAPLTAVVALLAFSVTGTSRTVALILYFGILTPVVGVAAQAYRYRRSPAPIERQQGRLMFWALTPALLLGLYVLTQRDTAFEDFAGRPIAVIPAELFRVFQPVFLLIPIALFVGILHYRLWNIDKVISRTLAYSVLAGFVTVVYVGVVVGVGRLIGTQQTGSSLWLSIIATGIIAVAFQPVKERVNRVVNRLVYGRRATPYEVLSALSERMAGTVATEDLLGRVARVIAEGTGARRVDVWLLFGNEARPAASWSDAVDSAPLPAVTVDGDDFPDIPGVTAVVPVRHHGELLGAITVVKAANEDITPTEERLLEDVGAQAGLVLRNVRLTAELVARLEELRASRQRLVAAQDEERRRLERNLHDGAQQQLVALKVQLGLAERLAEAGQPVGEMIRQLKDETGDALETLRDLARGIYPPLLAAEGLPSALAGQGRKASFSVEIQADSVGRYPQDVETAVYFVCLEAFQNASKYASANSVCVTLDEHDGELHFVVHDDGVGFDPTCTAKGSGTQNMIDRVEALDGSLSIDSAPDAGTRVEGRIPVPAAATPTPAAPSPSDEPVPTP